MPNAENLDSCYLVCTSRNLDLSGIIVFVVKGRPSNHLLQDVL